MYKVTVTIIAIAEDAATARAYGYSMVKGSRELSDHAGTFSAARAEVGPTEDPRADLAKFKAECEALEAKHGKGRTVDELDRAMAASANRSCMS